MVVGTPVGVGHGVFVGEGVVVAVADGVEVGVFDGVVVVVGTIGFEGAGGLGHSGSE